MSSEDLDEGDLECRNLSVHENSGQIKLDLETDVDVGAVDGRRPPKSKTTIRDLVQTGSLSVGEFLVLHRLFKAGRLLPEETLPGREICSLEERVLQDALHTAQGLNHVSSVVVQVPELAVVSLMRPPERVLLQNLVSLELGSDSPALVVGESVAILLEQGVDSGNSAIPRILQIFERDSPVLSSGLLSFKGILCPHALGIDELGFPWLDVPVQVWDELIFLVTHSRPEVRDTDVCLL